MMTSYFSLLLRNTKQHRLLFYKNEQLNGNKDIVANKQSLTEESTIKATSEEIKIGWLKPLTKNTVSLTKLAKVNQIS